MTVPNGNGARERSRSRGEQGESLVPIIDIGALSTNDKAAQKAVAQKIGKACEEIGFFVVVNHGIPSDVIDAAWNQTLDFFDLPLDEKKKYVSEDEAKNPYGHLAQLVWVGLREAFSLLRSGEIFVTVRVFENVYVSFGFNEPLDPESDRQELAHKLLAFGHGVLTSIQHLWRGYSVLGGEQLSRGKELENGNHSKQMGDLKDTVQPVDMCCMLWAGHGRYQPVFFAPIHSTIPNL